MAGTVPRSTGLDALLDPADTRCPLVAGLKTLEFGFNAGSALPLYRAKKKFRNSAIGICAAAVYFVANINAALEHAERRVKKNPAKGKSAKHTTPSSRSKPTKEGSIELAERRVRIGFIGFGRLARQLLSVLLGYGPVLPSDIIVSTPSYDEEEMKPFYRMGIEGVFDNVAVVQQAEVVFLCSPPHTLRDISSEVARHIAPQTIIYSLMAAVPVQRLCSLLRHKRLVVLPHGQSERENGGISMHSMTSLALEGESPVSSGASEDRQSTTGSSVSCGIVTQGNNPTPSDSSSNTEVQQLERSVACLTSSNDPPNIEPASDDPPHIETIQRPYSILALLTSRRECMRAFPLCRVIEGQDSSHNLVAAEHGLQWTTQLIACLWDMLHLQAGYSQGEAAVAINDILFNAEPIARPYRFKNRSKEIQHFSPRDFEVTAASEPATPRSWPGSSRNAGQVRTPESNALQLLDIHTTHQALHARLAGDQTVMRCLQDKYLVLLNNTPVSVYGSIVASFNCGELPWTAYGQLGTM